MALDLIYLTNNPFVAKIAENSGVQRIMVDLETIGKEERQKNMDTVKSHHTVEDISKVKETLTKAEMLVRINSWYENSTKEIDEVISAGADRIMLPMWKSVDEVDAFLKAVNGRVKTILLLETKEGVEILDKVIENSLIDEIYIGLNDLHLSYGLTFMFELLTNGVVERISKKLKAKGIKFGFGGIARLGDGMLSADRIVMEHYRLGSSIVILSRTFCDYEKVNNLLETEKLFEKNIFVLRQFESTMANKTKIEFKENRNIVKQAVDGIVTGLKEKKLVK